MNPKAGNTNIYDLVILGAGPAGLTAAIYGGRANLSTLVLEQMLVGGEIAASDQLDNYPGFPQGISGVEFGQLLEQQAIRFGAEVISASIDQADVRGDLKRVTTSRGDFYGRTMVVATGTSPRLL